MFLIFDTETTGLPKNFNAPLSDSENWPRVVQLSWQLHDFNGKLINHNDCIIYPDGFEIPIGVSSIHGISTEKAKKVGLKLEEVISIFEKDLENAKYLVGHNINFDVNILGAEYYRLKKKNLLEKKAVLDTVKLSVEYCAIPGGRGKKFKYPKLTELYEKLFHKPLNNAHNAAFDVEATAGSFFKLISLNIIKVQETNSQTLVYEAPKIDYKEPQPQKQQETNNQNKKEENKIIRNDIDFIHLHNHSEFTILESTTKITDLIKKAVEFKMPAIALTDKNNMMGAMKFSIEAKKHNIKPIIGCEINICKDYENKSHKDNGYPIILIAKNKTGYTNLIKLCSIANTKGFYYIPRIDKNLLLNYKEGLIALSGDIWGEICQKILYEGKEKAKQALNWWKAEFGEDYYLEINRHNFNQQEEVNQIVINLAHETKIKLVACNANFYISPEDADSQDILVCIKNGELLKTRKAFLNKQNRTDRFGLPNDNFYLKSGDEIAELFKDIPEAIQNTLEIAGKVENFTLKREVLLPKFKIPEKFENENSYLKYLTYKGAEKKYKVLTDQIKNRIDFELKVIANTGYPGYFLIVQDFIHYAKSIGITVGPGRGSAAGSVVAYCNSITNVNPIKYDLLFERFLNPERISMPDIDIDFDDVGRQKIINYVIKKYGDNQVAQIITYGTMAAKSSIRDAARVLNLELSEANNLTNLIPTRIGVSLQKILSSSPEELNKKYFGAEYQNALKLKKIIKENNLKAKTITVAAKIEGLIRNTGTHACGVIITPDNITDFVPISTVKDSHMVCTQFDNSVVESAGLLKMDFLGLSTLSIINETIKIIEEKTGEKIEIESISLEDEKTYQLFQKGNTVGVFQYESNGMRQYMRQMKPTEFNDLIALNALFRPGPMSYLPTYILRKHKKEKIVYDFPQMEEILAETYGITVYQEQVMQLSQLIGGFSKGEADTLRKAMGKKIIKELDKMRPLFFKNAEKKGFDKPTLEKIWKDWESFADYAFNKSHATCYALIGYQTAYLKAHYPSEFMAAILSNNLKDISKLSFFIEECQKMKIPVLGPDINESNIKFTVNKKGAIRFGLAAIKGVGYNVSENIINQRQKEGAFNSFIDFITRLDQKSVNKKTLESLAYSGAFDTFDAFRAAFFYKEHEGDSTFIEKAVKYSIKRKAEKNSTQLSLFSQIEDSLDIDPKIPKCPEWELKDKLIKEKEHVGIFISSHPMKNYKLELQELCSKENLKNMEKLEEKTNKQLIMAGIISQFDSFVSKKGNPYGSFVMEDFTSSYEFKIFKDTYRTFKEVIKLNEIFYIKGQIKEVKNYSTDKKENRFFINKIAPIDELLYEETKSVFLKINADNIEENEVINLEKTIGNNKGNLPVKVLFFSENKDSIKLISKKYKIDINKKIINTIKQNNNVSLSLNDS